MSAAPTPDRPAGGAPADGGAAARNPKAGERPGGPRLQPPPPEQHAPQLLGIDAAGAEHPQGFGEPDDESLIGRVWGCVCGWRGQPRDVTTRQFHPQVGDGGSLRRRRLARADRDARPELEAHLAAARPAAAPSAAAPPAPPPQRERERFRASSPPRRRLTLPRVPDNPAPASITPTSETSTGSGAGLEAQAWAQGAEDVRAPDADHYRTDLRAARKADPAAAAPGEPAAFSPDGGPDPRDRAPAERGAVADALSAAAAQTRQARDELAVAEQALDAAVAAARRDGASWRSIGRATGIPHRAAAARWGPPRAGPSL